MVAKSFARRLRDREALIGTLQSMHSADVSEMLAGAGYDWLFIEAMQSVREACLGKKLALGFFGVSPEAVQPWMEQGFTLITVGVDTLFLLSSAQDTLASLKGN